MELSWPILWPRYGVVGLLTNCAGDLVYLLVTWLCREPKLTVTLLNSVGVFGGYFGHARYSLAYQGRATPGLARYLIAHRMGSGTKVSLLYVSDLLRVPHRAVQARVKFIVGGVLFVLFKFCAFPPTHGGGRE